MYPDLYVSFAPIEKNTSLSELTSPITSCQHQPVGLSGRKGEVSGTVGGGSVAVGRTCTTMLGIGVMACVMPMGLTRKLVMIMPSISKTPVKMHAAKIFRLVFIFFLRQRAGLFGMDVAQLL
jgi:hypothetical protein